MNTARILSPASELTWRKSSYSGAEGGECVEIAATHGVVHIRDSKRSLDAPTLTVGRKAWAGFIGLVSGTQA